MSTSAITALYFVRAAILPPGPLVEMGCLCLTVAPVGSIRGKAAILQACRNFRCILQPAESSSCLYTHLFARILLPMCRSRLPQVDLGSGFHCTPAIWRRRIRNKASSARRSSILELNRGTARTYQPYRGRPSALCPACLVYPGNNHSCSARPGDFRNMNHRTKGQIRKP